LMRAGNEGILNILGMVVSLLLTAWDNRWA